MSLAFADFEHGKVNIVGGQLHYRIGGAGEPVVLLHGWPQHSLQWHSVAPRLAERYQVVVPDLPGCGGSSIPRAGYDKRTIAAKVAELVHQLKLGPVKRWSHFLRQPAKVGSPMQRTTHHEDAETVFG